jgi:Ni,Fe-hydrogenase III small subunit
MSISLSSHMPAVVRIPGCPPPPDAIAAALIALTDGR